MSMEYGHAQCPWSIVWTCPESLEYGHAQPMGPNGPGPNKWARMAQGPTVAGTDWHLLNGTKIHAKRNRTWDIFLVHAYMVQFETLWGTI